MSTFGGFCFTLPTIVRQLLHASIRMALDGGASPRRRGATLVLMPTTRPRHTVTETEEMARALDEAARRWPEDRGSRSSLLARLVQEGYRALRDERGGRAERRRSAVRRTSGALTGVYSADYLERLRDEWPE